MHNTIIRHFDYITKEITRVRFKKRIAEIRYIQVIGLSRRSPGENSARRNRRKRRGAGDSDGVKLVQSVGGRRFAPPPISTNGAKRFASHDQSPGSGRAVPRSSHGSAAEIKEEVEQEIEEGKGEKKRERWKKRREREKERDRENDIGIGIVSITIEHHHNRPRRRPHDHNSTTEASGTTAAVPRTRRP